MKIKLAFLVICLFLFQAGLFSAIVVNRSGPYYAGESIGFNKTCHDSFNRINSYWNWGDGSPQTPHSDDGDYGWQYHTFSSPGTYTVTYYHGTPISTPICFTDTETYTITIQESRSISYAPQRRIGLQLNGAEGSVRSVMLPIALSNSIT